MRKILLNAPVYSRSGYGEMARFALRALSSNPDIDLYVNPTNWGQTSAITNDFEEHKLINDLRLKTEQDTEKKYHTTVHVTIPNEFKAMSRFNIGYTAGIETNHISPAWYDACRLVDKIITISNHSKDVFVNSEFKNPAGDLLKFTLPCEVVWLPHNPVKPTELNLEIKTPFNFLTVNQWGVRKNLEFLITNFLEEFRGNDQVGLIIKTSCTNDSTMDRFDAEAKLKMLLAKFPDSKAKVYLIHGIMTEQEMAGLYTHPSVKAFVTTTHGEGYGLSIMQAAAYGLPVIATNWSGHLDFLCMEEDGEQKEMFSKVNYELRPIQPQAVWQGVLEPQTSWAYCIPSHFKKRLKEMTTDYTRLKSRAKKLSEHVVQLLEAKKLEKQFVEQVLSVGV